MVYFTFFGLKEKRAIYAGSRIKIGLRVHGSLYHLWRKLPGGGGWTPHMKGMGMLVGNFELTPKGDRSGRGRSFF